jgi:micrococcal nuclease
MRKLRLLVLVSLLFIFVSIATSSSAKSYETRVVKVVDGDTLTLSNGEKVRLIGVDTPERTHSLKAVRSFAKEAGSFTKKMVEGKEVRLEFDWQKRDRYKRLLAYVYLKDGTFLNAEIIKQGYGFAYTKFPFKYSEEFRKYQKEAKENNRGLWSRAGEHAEGLKVVPWMNAHKYYNQKVIVEGNIVVTHNSGRACFLNFHKDWKKYFTAVIFRSDFDKFPEQPELYYKGKRVRVAGVVKKYKGKPEIILKHPCQIEIIASGESKER